MGTTSGSRRGLLIPWIRGPSHTGIPCPQRADHGDPGSFQLHHHPFVTSHWCCAVAAARLPSSSTCAATGRYGAVVHHGLTPG